MQQNSQKKGTITLTCQIDEDQEVVVISVTDTGIGIPTDKQEWVFERFTKVDDFKPGTGLGLYICRIIIQRFGGNISIDTCYTKGCKVLVYADKIAISFHFCHFNRI